VVLAVIALISVPLLLGVIEDSKKGSFKDTAYGLIASAELYYAKAELKETVPVTTFNCDYNTCGELTFKGAIPKGILTIYSDSSISLSITNGKYCAYKNGNQSDVTVVEGDCNGITVMQYASGNSTDETTTNLQNQIKSLQDQLVSLQTINSELSSKISTLESDNTTIKADIATNKTDITTLKTDNTTNKTDIAILKTSNTSLATSVTTLQTANTTTQTKVTSLQTSVNNAKQNLTFSTTEKATGDKWIDGKPIYTKTMYFGALPNATTKTLAHGIANVNEIWLDSNNSYVTGSGNAKLSISMFNSWYAKADTTSVYFVTAADRTANTAYVTFLYTKTTD